MTEVGFVGAGAAAAAGAFVLDGAAADANITVLEKSGGLCGRAATRRRDGVTYDYGANYLKDDDDRVTELVTDTLDSDGLVNISEPVYTFDADGVVSEGRDADECKWSYRTGLTQLAKRLFARTDATIHRETRVEQLVRDGDNWRLVDDGGRRWGPFDVVVLNPPAPQTAALLRDAEWDSKACSKLEAAAGNVEYRTVWTAVLHYPFPVDRPYYGLVNTDKNHDIGWISREECKPGHLPEGETLLIVQANHDWSVEHYDQPPTENIRVLANQTAEVVGDDRLAEPDWTDHQGWRYALPEQGTLRGPLREAEEAGLFVLGDWVPGEARLHAAVRNGLEVGERLAYAV